MADPDVDEPAEKIGEVIVYGLRDRKRIKQLIDALAAIPVCPSLIYRINKYGTHRDNLCKFVGVRDWITRETYYVRIHSWGDKGPVIGWSLDYWWYGKYMKARAARSLLAFESGLGIKPVKVKFAVHEHADDYAKTAQVAS